MKGDRFVLDTNVLISAALSVSAPPARVTRWVVAHGRPVFSEPTFEELRTRLWRPKFDRYVSIERRNEILHDFSAIADWVDIRDTATPVPSRDPDDDMLVRTAVAAGAVWLVTGDDDLLSLAAPEGVTILSPAQMLDGILAQFGSDD